jgi:photosystem II stability/assembly factor-like uncharacterized protein
MRRFTVSLVVLFVVAASAHAQITASFTDISPSQSSLDASDADAASGGRVHNLGSPDGKTFYAASEWGGLFKSEDVGRTWTHLPGHVPHVTWDVAVAAADPRLIYATSLYDGRVKSISGINVSSDGGTTWKKPESATPPEGFCVSGLRRDEPAAYGIGINPENSKHVVIGTNCGVAISDDAGGTWRFVDPTPRDRGASDVWDVVVHHGGIIDTCGADGHRRSTDGGETWRTAATNPLPAGRCSIAVSPDESYVLFAVVGTSLFESDNGGESWPHTFVNPSLQGRIPFFATNQRSGKAFDLWFGDIGLHRAGCTTPANPAAGGDRRCPSNSWSQRFTRDFGGHDDTGDIAFTSERNDACPVLFSSDGGVYFNTQTTHPDCQTPKWEQPRVTPHALWLMAMTGVHEPGQEEHLYFGAQDNGPFGTKTAPQNAPAWTNARCCDGFDVSADRNRSLFTVCCSNVGTRVFTSTAGMAAAPAGLANRPAGNLSGFRYIDIIGTFGDKKYAITTSNGVFFTNDVTANPIVWTQLGAATTPATPRGIQIAVRGGTPSFIVQTGVGDGMSEDRLFRFDGTGAGDWKEIEPPGGKGGFGIFGVDPRDANRILVSHLLLGQDPQMMLTTDGGTSWTSLTELDALMTGNGDFRYVTRRGLSHSANAIGSQSGYPQPTMVAIDGEDGTIMAAGGADSGVFVSTNSGRNWTLVSDPRTPFKTKTPHIPRPRFAYFDHEASSVNLTLERRLSIYVGSQGRGVWRLGLRLPVVITPTFCQQHPGACPTPTLTEGLIEVSCGRGGIAGAEFDCVIVDPIPENCTKKFSCPGCGPSGLCPPWYRFVIDNFDRKQWLAGIVTSTGEPVDYEVLPSRNGVIVSFRPDPSKFVERKIGDYQLVLAHRAGPTPPGRMKFPVRLETGSQPFSERQLEWARTNGR